MLRNNDQRDAGITQDEVLDALKRSGRPNFNKRLLTHFSSRTIGLLPELRPRLKQTCLRLERGCYRADRRTL